MRQNIETCDGEEIAIRPNQAMIDYHHICSVSLRHKNQKLALLVNFDAVSIESGFKGTPHKKKIDFFWALHERGGRTFPDFFYPFSHHVVPYILTSILCYVFFNTKIIKVPTL